MGRLIMDSGAGESGVCAGDLTDSARPEALALPVLLASSRAVSLHEVDINKMLAELRAEREQVEEAIIQFRRV